MMKNSRLYLLDLLDIICDIFGGEERHQDWFGESIEMGCPRHTDHKIGAVGFLLLEEVEAAMGSTMQKLKWLQMFREKGEEKERKREKR